MEFVISAVLTALGIFHPSTIISNGIVGVCISAPLRGGVATGSPCPGGKDAPSPIREEWRISGTRIISASGRCLKAGSPVTSGVCTPNHSIATTWHRNGLELQSGKRCLDLAKPGYFGPLTMSRCNSGRGTENWFQS